MPEENIEEEIKVVGNDGSVNNDETVVIDIEEDKEEDPISVI